LEGRKRRVPRRRKLDFGRSRGEEPLALTAIEPSAEPETEPDDDEEQQQQQYTGQPVLIPQGGEGISQKGGAFFFLVGV
jgi:hypothetical protein